MEGSRAHRALSKVKTTIEDCLLGCFFFCVLFPIVWYEDIKEERNKKKRAKQKLWEAVEREEKKNNGKP